MLKLSAYLVASCILMVVTGCGSSGPQLLPVSGKVSTKDGKPCDNALVVFHPQEAERVNDPKPFAKTDEQGNFKLTTNVEGDGAIAGKYGVTIVWQSAAKESKFSLSGEGQGSSGDRLNGKYANPGQPQITIEVKAGTNNQVDLSVEG